MLLCDSNSCDDFKIGSPSYQLSDKAFGLILQAKEHPYKKYRQGVMGLTCFF